MGRVWGPHRVPRNKEQGRHEAITMRVTGTPWSRHSLIALFVLSNLVVFPMEHVSVDIRAGEREKPLRESSKPLVLGYMHAAHPPTKT